MKKLISLLFAAVLIVSMVGCNKVIGPGHVGIKVYNSGSDKGVLDSPVSTGRVFYTPFQSYVIEYPTSIQTVKWTASANEGKPIDESITFTNKEQMIINGDFSLSYSLVADKVPAFYVKFHTDDLATFTDGFLRNVTRDCLNEHAGKYEIEQIMGDNAEFLKQSRACVQDQVGPFGVKIEQFGIIGAPRPPQAIVDAINMKVQAQQLTYKKQMELTQVEADAKKLVAQTQGEATAKVAEAEGNAKARVAEANGTAEANRAMNASITPQLMDNKRLDIQREWVEKWNGAQPSTVLGGNAQPLISIPTGK